MNESVGLDPMGWGMADVLTELPSHMHSDLSAGALQFVVACWLLQGQLPAAAAV